MGRIYKPKHKLCTDRTKLREAFKYRVDTKCSIRAAAERFGVKVMTLQVREDKVTSVFFTIIAYCTYIKAFFIIWPIA